MEAAENESGFDLPPNSPKWVERALIECLKLTIPTIKTNKMPQSGIEYLAKTTGHLVWLTAASNGIDHQLEQAAIKMEENMGGEKFDELLKKCEPFTSQIETMWNNFECLKKKKSDIANKIMQIVIEKNINDQSEFFAAYTKALNYPIFNDKGRPSAETYSSLTNIYYIMILNWQRVALMHTRREIYNWLCTLLDKSQVGGFERVEQICKRLKIRLAKTGRPKNKIRTKK